MNGHIETTYLLELKRQCVWALEAVDAMNATLSGERGSSRVYDFFKHAGHFLHHAGAVSRILWPPAPKRKEKGARASERGLQLLAALGLNDSHVLKQRTLRDHIEHLDERIDDWAYASRNHNIVDFTLGKPGTVSGGGIDPSDIFRQYDPATRIFIFRGESFDIQGLAQGIADVVRRLDARLPPPWGNGPRRD